MAIGEIIAGVDEAGRGPWAGPVVAAAVVLDGSPPAGVTDSKKLSPRRRAALFDEIMATASIGIGAATVEEIDRLNILKATFLAMRRAVEALPTLPDRILVDGNQVPDLPCPAEAIVKGDLTVPAISAASIIAKVTRDRMMADYANHFPGFGFESNQGYGTAAHQAALVRLGPCPVHRRSFRPVHNILCKEKVVTR